MSDISVIAWYQKYSLCIPVNRCVMIVLHNVCYILCGLYA